MGDRNEPTYDEVKRDTGTSYDRVQVSSGGPRSASSIQKVDIPTENALPTSLIYGRLRDLKFAVEEGNDVISDLFAKFDSVLSPETESNEGPSSDTNVLSTNSELYDAIGQLERHVRKQHSQLRYLMERCEL